MAHKNVYPSGKSGEMPTPGRYKISLDGIDYRDFTRDHPAGKIRYISYEDGNELQSQTRKRLLSQHLILGKELPSRDDGSVSFRIPISSRPISYDAASNDVDNNNLIHESRSYSDAHLFRDAADLLKALSRARRYSQIGYLQQLGQLLIATEFTDPGQRTLFLAPGIERTLHHTDNTIEAIAINYRERMSQEFGERFEPFSTEFEARISDISR